MTVDTIPQWIVGSGGGLTRWITEFGPIDRLTGKARKYYATGAWDPSAPLSEQDLHISKLRFEKRYGRGSYSRKGTDVLESRSKDLLRDAILHPANIMNLRNPDQVAANVTEVDIMDLVLVHIGSLPAWSVLMREYARVSGQGAPVDPSEPGGQPGPAPSAELLKGIKEEVGQAITSFEQVRNMREALHATLSSLDLHMGKLGVRLFNAERLLDKATSVTP
jgi:hypothetical protein